MRLEVDLYELFYLGLFMLYWEIIWGFLSEVVL
jgi:hypothetical protein